MTQKEGNGISEISGAIHQYYMDIINCMPNMVYWIDIHCELKGSNNHFVKLLGLTDLQNFTGTPYELLTKYAHWPAARVDALMLDDMSTIFAGAAKYNVEEPSILDKQNKELSYLSTRVPLFGKQKQVIGLVVILTDITDRNKVEKPGTIAEPRPDYMLMEHPNGRVPRLLMVEDNPIAQKVEHALLASFGCQVDMAESGEAALSLFAPGKYDVVFMDIGLQDTSGYIVAKKIREKEKETEHHVPIIAITAYQAEVVKDDCREYFMDGVITKPLTTQQAQQIIQRYVYREDILIHGLETG